MNYTQNIFLEVLMNAIHKRRVDIYINDEVDWEHLHKLSVDHNIVSLFYFGLSKCGLKDKIPKDIFNELKKQSFFSISNQINRSRKIGNILKIFNQNNIRTVALKGLVVKDFYPRPEFRTMSDADIVVKKENLDKAINILKKLGYEQGKETNVDISFRNGNSIIELHWNLINTGRVFGGEQFENDLWNDLININIEGENTQSLNYEDLAVHLTVHLIKHLADKGCGIRQFCDLVVLFESKEEEINWDRYFMKIREYNLEKATRIVLYICTRYLGMNLKHKVTDEKYINVRYLNILMDDILEHGVFGQSNKGEVVARARAFNGDKDNSTPFRQYFKMFFPPVKRILDNYHYAEKCKILLPIAYIHRLIRCIFNRELSMKEKAEFCTKGLSVIKERNPMMQWLGL